MSEATKRPPRFSLSTWILIGILLGAGVGLFLGEPAAALQPLGDAFIRLLQMTILPYMVVALIAGLGKLTMADARLLALRGGAVMVLFWVVGFAIILAIPATFPQLESASFFSTTTIEQRQTPNFVSLYIPANPFHSLANGIIPAVVLFCLALGVALITVERKEIIVTPLQTVSQALMRVAQLVVYLTPIGVFAITASAAGTMTVDEFDRLQPYLVGFIVATLIFTFVLLPALVAILTPFKFWDVVRVCQGSMLTGFATGNLFVVLPIIIENCNELFERHAPGVENADSYIDVVIPVSFNFPNIGKLLILLFIPFAGWYSGHAMSLGDYPNFVMLGLASFFGGVDLAIPFLLEVMKIPVDLYELYIVTGVVTGRFATLLGVMNLLAFTLVTTCAVTGLVRIRKHRLLTLGSASIALSIAALATTRVALQHTVESEYTKDQVIATMQLLRDPMTAVVHERVPENAPEPSEATNALDRVLERGVIRVGFIDDNMPYTYLNAAGQLVGFEVEMANHLARDLEVELDFVPVTQENIGALLSEDKVDIVMAQIVATPERLSRVSMSSPYMDVTLALVLKQEDAKTFADSRTLHRLPPMKLAVPTRDEYFLAMLAEVLPQAELVHVASARDFFDLNFQGAEVLVVFAEQGSAWTLLYPSYEVVVPKPDLLQLPVGYVVPRGDAEMLNFINRWIELKLRDGTIRTAYRYWILGEGTERRGPRWSIMRNVLGWGKASQPAQK